MHSDSYEPQLRVYLTDSQESSSFFSRFSARKWPVAIPFAENLKNHREISSDYQSDKPEAEVMKHIGAISLFNFHDSFQNRL